MLGESYEEFVEKFKPKKTTDDCYTPEPVYNAVRDWVAQEYGLDVANFVRPFYPGGDYEHFNYSADSVVVDNPPFSIFSKIFRFYLDKKIKFFLFAPHKTLFCAKSSNGVCSILCDVNIKYKNGAVIETAFITNLDTPGVRTASELRRRIQATQEKNKAGRPVYRYPPELLTFSSLATINQMGIDFRVDASELYWVDKLDAQRICGVSIYGNGFLMSTTATQRLQEAKAQAQEAKAIKWQLSERERMIIHCLDRGESGWEASLFTSCPV